jgi:hypothetical protein
MPSLAYAPFGSSSYHYKSILNGHSHPVGSSVKLHLLKVGVRVALKANYYKRLDLKTLSRHDDILCSSLSLLGQELRMVDISCTL